MGYFCLLLSLSLSTGSKRGDPSSSKLGSYLIQSQFQVEKSDAKSLLTKLSRICVHSSCFSSSWLHCLADYPSCNRHYIYVDILSCCYIYITCVLICRSIGK